MNPALLKRSEPVKDTNNDNGLPELGMFHGSADPIEGLAELWLGGEIDHRLAIDGGPGEYVKHAVLYDQEVADEEIE